jgi:hypothetical protein
MKLILLLQMRISPYGRFKSRLPTRRSPTSGSGSRRGSRPNVSPSMTSHRACNSRRCRTSRGTGHALRLAQMRGQAEHAPDWHARSWLNLSVLPERSGWEPKWEPTCSAAGRCQAMSSHHCSWLAPRRATRGYVRRPAGADLGAGGRGFESRHPDQLFRIFWR